MAARIADLARMLREQSGVGDRLPIDVDAIVGWSPLELAEVPYRGFLGLYAQAGKSGGILISEDQSPQRRRFTIGHELGHFAIPTHQGQTICFEEDILRPRVDNATEREASEFAAELLMPRHLFRRALGDADPSFRTVKRLAAADCFDVSITACAIRLVSVTCESVALVCASNGRIAWKKWSDSFRYAIPSPGRRVPPGTCIAHIRDGEAPSDRVEAVSRHAWFTARDETVEVLESTFAIPMLGQTLSLLWAVERD